MPGRAHELHGLQVLAAHRHVAHHRAGPDLHGDAVAGDVEGHAGEPLSRLLVAEIEPAGAHHHGLGLAHVDLTLTSGHPQRADYVAAGGVLAVRGQEIGDRDPVEHPDAGAKGHRPHHLHHGGAAAHQARGQAAARGGPGTALAAPDLAALLDEPHAPAVEDLEHVVGGVNGLNSLGLVGEHAAAAEVDHEIVARHVGDVRPGRQRRAAAPAEHGLVHQQHVRPRLARANRGHGAGGAAADDQYLGLVMDGLVAHDECVLSEN